MNRSTFSKISWLWILAAVLFFTACKDENTPEPDETSTVPQEVLKINKFIKDHMDIYYYWNTSMPNINYRLEADTELYFEKLLKTPDDRWSFVTDDIAGLEAYFSGVSKSPGYSIRGYLVEEDSDQVVFFVEYVYANSPASEAGLQRGDMFYKVNGQVLTINNYGALLNADAAEITLGQFNDGGSITELSPSVTIIAQENLAQHPIVASNIIELGDKKIAYLAYTSFISNYDTELEDLFKDFKAAGVNEVVLDLRYNGGGSVSTAIKLGSMLAPATANKKTFIYERFNNTLRQYNELLPFDLKDESNLNLSRLYVLTTENTASASEMIIYGLDPYLEIIQIGAETHGKYYASITISDNMEPEKRTHNWAIQPIVLKSENATNSIDYTKGLPADYKMDDNWYNADLGDPEENFLAAAIEHITTGSISADRLEAAALKSSSIAPLSVQPFPDPLHGTMYIDALPSR